MIMPVHRDHVPPKAFEDRNFIIGGASINISRYLRSVFIRASWLVNPHDIDGMARTLEEALDASDQEKRWRMAALRQVLDAGDVRTWAARFLSRLDPARDESRRLELSDAAHAS